MAYEEFVLDESILELDDWLPQEAVQEIVQAILFQDKMFIQNISRDREYIVDDIDKKVTENYINYSYVKSVSKLDFELNKDIQVAA